MPDLQSNRLRDVEWSSRDGKGRSNVKVADAARGCQSRPRRGVAEELRGAGGPGPQGQRPEGRTLPSEASQRADEPRTELVPVHLPPAVEASVNSSPPAVMEFVPARSVRRRRLWILGCLVGGIGIGAMGVLLLPEGRGAVKLSPLSPVLSQPVLGLPTSQAHSSTHTPAPVGQAASPGALGIGPMMSPLAIPTPRASQSPAPTDTPTPGASPTATPAPTPTPSRRRPRPRPP